MDQPDITPLESKAIQAALNGNWREAIELNLEIIELAPKNLASLNRLGTAYLKISEASSARKTFKKVLKINPNNLIAIKNLSNIKHQPQSRTNQSSTKIVSFVEEPGISKIIPLMKPGSPQTIAGLTVGQTVTLKPSTRRIKVFSEDTKEYLGRLPDDISPTLSKLIKLGYKYQTFIKSTNPKYPKVFIQETKRSKRLNDVPSFPLKNGSKKTVNVSYKKPVSHPLEIFDPLTEED